MQPVQINAALAAVDFSDWTGPVLRAAAEMARLYEAPLTSFGRNAVDRFFTPAEIKEIVALAEHVAA